MGFVFKNNSFSEFEIISVDTFRIQETWNQVWREKQEILNYYRQLTIALQEVEGKQRKLMFN